MSNEAIAKRALEIAEELRAALPLNTDFAEGWQQRYLDRQNERYEKALEMARAEAEIARKPWPEGAVFRDIDSGEFLNERGEPLTTKDGVNGLDGGQSNG